MRAYLLAIGLTTLMIGLFLWFAGSVDIGCTVSGMSPNLTFSDCGGATELDIAGATLTVAAVVMIVGTWFPAGPADAG
ncbi:MAG: hypothetical protein L3K02_06815 [Thermoplasmata archaeon]|nr:hypothetical protein [Thermoplasmata archaeon]